MQLFGIRNPLQNYGASPAVWNYTDERASS